MARAALSEACCSADSGQMLREFAGRSARGQARGGLQPLHREVSLVVRPSITSLLLRVKTGLYPREEIPFEELSSGVVVENKSAKLFRSNSRLYVDRETLNKIQNKKNAEKQIETKENDLAKGNIYK